MFGIPIFYLESLVSSQNLYPLVRICHQTDWCRQWAAGPGPELHLSNGIHFSLNREKLCGKQWTKTLQVCRKNLVLHRVNEPNISK